MKKKRYLRDESLYNMIQENEILTFLEYLPLVVCHVIKNENSKSRRGRPPKNLFDILVCLSIKQYFDLSLRRSMGLIRMLTSFMKVPIDIPCFKTLDNYLNKKYITEYLQEIVKALANPYGVIERYFATDATGISTSTSSSWYDIKINKISRKKDHIMVHISVGTQSNVVTNVDVCVKNGGDNKIFREHVKDVGERFNVEEWSGDSAYLARENCTAVSAIGALPYFKLKSNTITTSKGSRAWHDMVRRFRDDPDSANKCYHRRSNVESTNSAKKRKFNKAVRSKNDRAKINEEMLGWSSYNFSLLSRLEHEFRVYPDFAM